MSEEYLDVLNNRGEQTGQSKSYIDAHKYGLIHRAVHVWILNTKNQLLLQKRSADRRAYPNYWDISVSGHISSEETSLEAAKNETQEEIGLNLPSSAFTYLFTLEEHIVLNGGTYVNNEFQDVYLVRLEKNISDIQFDKIELSDVQWVDMEEFRNLIGDEKYKLVSHDEEYRRLFEYIR